MSKKHTNTLIINTLHDVTIIVDPTKKSHYKDFDSIFVKEHIDFSKKNVFSKNFEDDTIIHLNPIDLDDGFIISKRGVGDLHIEFKRNIKGALQIDNSGVGDITSKTHNGVLLPFVHLIQKGTGDFLFKDAFVDILEITALGVGDLSVSVDSCIFGSHKGVGDVNIFAFEETKIDDLISKGTGDVTLKKCQFKQTETSPQKKSEEPFSLKIIEDEEIEDSSKQNSLTLNACSNCGFNINEPRYLIDCIYPIDVEYGKWLIGCMSHHGGCGRHVYGYSKEDVISRWNNNETDTFIDRQN